MSGYTCDASTECCRFSITGREPQVTQAEWNLVVAEVKRQGRRMPSVPDDDDGRCPFLDDALGKCRVYQSRPLGCRTFFCERARDEHGVAGAPSSSTRELRDAARTLEDLRVATRDDDGRARPLRSWVRSASSTAKITAKARNR